MSETNKTISKIITKENSKNFNLKFKAIFSGQKTFN